MRQAEAQRPAWVPDPPWRECKPCDVRWKSTESETCWCCGQATATPGLPPSFPGYHGMSLNFG